MNNITKDGYKNYPDSEYRYFLYDPQDNDFYYFKTIEERDRYFETLKDSYLDDYWDEEVERIIAGEITHVTARINYRKRPDNLDEDGCDEEGTNWRDWEYMCNYALTPIIGGSK